MDTGKHFSKPTVSQDPVNKIKEMQRLVQSRQGQMRMVHLIGKVRFPAKRTPSRLGNA